MNIGASAVTDYGDYFAWGETSKRYTSISGSSFVGGLPFIEDNAPFYDGIWEFYSDEDHKMTLDAADDVAVALWGGSWRMPDKADLEFLLDDTYCTAEWTYDYNSTGEAGLLVTGKGDYAGNSIFLPAAGYGSDDSVEDDGVCGFYFSRSRDEVIAIAYSLCFHGDGQDVYGYKRSYGCSVRPVLVIPE